MVLATWTLLGPPLAFPEILPADLRPEVTTVAAIIGGLIGIYLLRAWKTVAVAVAVIVAMATLSWMLNTLPTPGALRHYSGVSLGVLTMGTVAWASGSGLALLRSTSAFALLAGGVLMVGLGSVSITTAKVVDPSIEPPRSLYEWLPNWKLELPGVSDAGSTGGRPQVNSNALAGTALLILPTCIGLAVAGRRATRANIQRLGLFVSILAAAIVIIALSRTAIASMILTAIALAIVSRRRVPILVMFVAGFALLIASVAVVSLTSAPALRSPASETRSTATSRLAMWQEALERIAEKPSLGIGISQFHEVRRLPTVNTLSGATYVAHAHNAFLQVGLDIGLPGLTAYMLVFAILIGRVERLRPWNGESGAIALGACFSLVSVHLFGATDAIALGAKVGGFQWYAAGLALAATSLQEHSPALARQTDPSVMH